MAVNTRRDNEQIVNLSSLIDLVDDIDEHLSKSLALGSLLTLDNVLSIERELLEYYFKQINDELWQVKTAWQQLSEKFSYNVISPPG